MSNIDKYTSFIAEQVRKSSVAGLRAISESAKLHPDIAKYTKNAHSVDKVHDKDGHQVHVASYDEHAAYHHIDDKGKHTGSIGHGNDESVPSLRTIKKHLPGAPDHVHKAIHKDMKDNSFDDD